MFYTESRALDIYCLQFTVSVSNIVSKQWYRRKNNRYRIEINITSIAHHYYFLLPLGQPATIACSQAVEESNSKWQLTWTNL